jgi:hypothetical protein
MIVGRLAIRRPLDRGGIFMTVDEQKAWLAHGVSQAREQPPERERQSG